MTKIEVGKKYVNTLGEVREVLFVTEKSCFVRFPNGEERAFKLTNIERQWTEVASKILYVYKNKTSKEFLFSKISPSARQDLEYWINWEFTSSIEISHSIHQGLKIDIIKGIG